MQNEKTDQMVRFGRKYFRNSLREDIFMGLEEKLYRLQQILEIIILTLIGEGL